MATVVGVDVGGTFTDFIGYDSATRTLVIDKRPTTLRDQVSRLHAAGAEAVAICLMHSYKDSRHEAAVERAVTEALPEAYVARSSTVYAEIGEFERMSTAVVSAYVGPVMRQYFSRLDRRLRERGFARDFMVVQSNAGAV